MSAMKAEQYIAVWVVMVSILSSTTSDRCIVFIATTITPAVLSRLGPRARQTAQFPLPSLDHPAYPSHPANSNTSPPAEPTSPKASSPKGQRSPRVKSGKHPNASHRKSRKSKKSNSSNTPSNSNGSSSVSFADLDSTEADPDPSDLAIGRSNSPYEPSSNPTNSSIVSTGGSSSSSSYVFDDDIEGDDAGPSGYSNAFINYACNRGQSMIGLYGLSTMLLVPWEISEGFTEQPCRLYRR